MATENQLQKSAPAMPGKVPLGAGVGVLWTRARMAWAGMQSRQRAWAVVTSVLLAGLACFLAWYALRPDWRVLYSDLDTDDARQVGEELTAAQIPFDVAESGGILRVPAAQLDKARLATSAKGGVKSGRMGFELFDKPNWVGSEFDEQVNYQRALEGELEHTVASLADVESARVHLVMAHDSLFRDQDRAAKASVVLKLRHRTLAEGEPESIRNLVAAAVDGLASDQVILVDAAGHLPLGPKTADAVRLSAEQALEEKLVSTLEPVTGAGNVRASVSLDYDATSSDQSEETYDPDQTATLSMQRTEQTSGSQPVAAGVPGTASNAPNSQALPVYPHEATPPQSAKSESGTYGVSRVVRHTTEAPGRVRRLTAAIVVNDREVEAAAGNKPAAWQVRSPDELRNLTALAQAAVGFDSQRGDVVTVQDLAFDDNRAQAPITPAARALKQAEQSPELVKYGVVLLGILIVMAFGVRPALKRVVATPAKSGSARDKNLPAPNAMHPPALASPPAPQFDPERQRAQEIFDQVSGAVKKEPAQSSRLIQSWIHSD
ncbi:MAG TPA: flagellar basal-body MS-ring/collar protein FliF [Terracidiphilus sp.]